MRHINFIQGDITDLYHDFDILVQGCNCFCMQGAGLARTFAREYDTLNPTKYPMEYKTTKGDINKLGNIDWYSNSEGKSIVKDPTEPYIINAYTQYEGGPNAELGAIIMCFSKINRIFEGMSICIPQIGSGIGGLNWDDVYPEIIRVTPSLDVTFIEYAPY